MSFGKSLVLFFLFTFFALPSVAQAETKLGLALKQGYYDYPYISEIDPNGIGAASGFMKGDHIKEVGSVSIWFTGQARRFFKYNIKKGKPFIVMVKRYGSLQRVIVDLSKSPKSFPKHQGTDKYSSCYLAPTIACINTFITKPTDAQAARRMSGYYNNIIALSKIGKLDKARSQLKELETLYYQDPKNVRYNTGTVTESMAYLDIKPDQRLANFVYLHTDKTKTSDLLSKASLFIRHETPQHGQRFLDHVIQIFAENPKEVRYAAASYGRMLAAYKKHVLLRTITVSSKYRSEDKNKILQAALMYHLGQEDMKSAQKVQDIILNVQRSSTDKDLLLFIKLFNKTHNMDARHRMLSLLMKNYENGEGKFMIQALLFHSVVKGLGASGQIHKARTYIEKHATKDPVSIMMALAVEAAHSRSSNGLAVQFYKDFPKLLNDTYTLLKAMPLEKRQKLNPLVLRDFYVVLAAYLPINPSTQDVDGIKRFDKYDYGPIIESFVEVRKYGPALQWTDVAERKFGNTYKYGDIFASLGGIASGKDMALHTQHLQFRKHSNRFHSKHMERLYWKGHMDRALIEFNQLDETNKVSAILKQAMFVAPCKSCDL